MLPDVVVVLFYQQSRKSHHSRRQSLTLRVRRGGQRERGTSRRWQPSPARLCWVAGSRRGCPRLPVTDLRHPRGHHPRRRRPPHPLGRGRERLTRRQGQGGSVRGPTVPWTTDRARAASRAGPGAAGTRRGWQLRPRQPDSGAHLHVGDVTPAPHVRVGASTGQCTPPATLLQGQGPPPRPHQHAGAGTVPGQRIRDHRPARGSHAGLLGACLPSGLRRVAMRRVVEDRRTWSVFPRATPGNNAARSNPTLRLSRAWKPERGTSGGCRRRLQAVVRLRVASR